MIIKLGTRIIQMWMVFLLTIFIHFWILTIPDTRLSFAPIRQVRYFRTPSMSKFMIFKEYWTSVMMSLCWQKPKMARTKPCKRCSRSFQMSAWRWTSQSVTSISTHWHYSDLCFQPKESLQTQRRLKQFTMPVHQPLPLVSEVFLEWQHIVLSLFWILVMSLCELTIKDTPFWWTEEYEMSFKRIKQLMTSDTVVALTKPRKQNWSRMHHLGILSVILTSENSRTRGSKSCCICKQIPGSSWTPVLTNQERTLGNSLGHRNAAHIPVPKAMSLSEIQQATKTLQNLMEMISTNQWETNADRSPEGLDLTEFQLFGRIRDELTVSQDTMSFSVVIA